MFTGIKAHGESSFEELEALLISADFGVPASLRIVGDIRERYEQGKIATDADLVQVAAGTVMDILNSRKREIHAAPAGTPTVILMVGVNGSGKTTTIGKLAARLKGEGKKVVLAACDTFRAAAVEQLQLWGERTGCQVISAKHGADPASVAFDATKAAIAREADYLLIDTAGRLHIDEELMAELVKIKEATGPSEILLVVDAMLGQDAVNVAKTFNDLLDITGVVLTKMDGDTRGGAALSVKYITGKPIKFIGTGEKLDALELFHPDRMASRILGMGDILSLIEKAEQAYDEKNSKELEKKMREQTFSLDDFLEQMRQLKKMGNLEQLLAMVPGVNAGSLKNAQLDESQMAKTEAIILSMTKQERLKPEIINGSRRKRIANGSGTTVEDVNKLLKQFEQMKKMMKQFSNMGKRRGFGGIKLPF